MMKKLFSLVFALALCISISASALAAPAVKDAPVQIITSVSTKEFKTPDGQTVMTVHTEIPVLSGGPSEAATESINAYYRAMAKEYVASLEKEYLQDALGEAGRLKELGMAYRFYKGFQAAYNANGLLSIFFENSYDLTGAHRTSAFKGETTDLRTGKKLALGDILPDVPSATKKLFKQVDTYVKKNGLTEFLLGSDSPEQQYDQNDFVLTPKGIRFFFQQYAIAPYSSGMPSFDLKYKELGALSVPAKAAKDNTAENSIREALPDLLDQNVSLRGIPAYTYTLSNITKSKGTLTIHFSDTAGARGQFIVPLKKEDGEWRMGKMA